jgi:hypothetical protein
LLLDVPPEALRLAMAPSSLTFLPHEATVATCGLRYGGPLVT